MNKYIISQLIMTLLVTFHASAMEIVQDKKNPSIPVGDVCYFAKMPVEILSHIASCLMESDEEFIERIAIQSEKRVTWGKILLEFCPDKTKTIECLYGSDMQITLTIRNVHNNNCKAVYTKKCDKDCFFERIALSSAGDTVAMLYHEWLYNPSILLIKNIHTEQEQLKKVYLPLEVKTIAFNKQGTRLIVYGKNRDTAENMHKMFYLKKVDNNKPGIVVDSSESQVMEVEEDKSQINELQNYLRDKCVCNKFLEDAK